MNASGSFVVTDFGNCTKCFFEISILFLFAVIIHFAYISCFGSLYFVCSFIIVLDVINFGVL